MKNKNVFTLMLCVLVVVTSELQTAGMMPYVAQDINVNVGKVGILVTFYALGMALGGPAIVFVLRKTPPKIALVSAMLLYSLLEMLTIAHSSILWLTLFRFLTGSLSGGCLWSRPVLRCQNCFSSRRNTQRYSLCPQWSYDWGNNWNANEPCHRRVSWVAVEFHSPRHSSCNRKRNSLGHPAIPKPSKPRRRCGRQETA